LEPFRIVCPSCHGKLVIRHDGLLGKSIHCPRCKAVLALPTVPPDPSHVTEAKLASPVSYDSSAITRVDDGTLAKQVAETVIPTGEDLASLDDYAIASAVEAYRASSSSQVDVPTLLNTSVAREQTPEELLPPMEWNTPATQRRRQILMLGMASLAGLLLASIGLAIFLTSQSASKTKIANNIEPVAPTAAEPTNPNATIEGPPNPSTNDASLPSPDKKAKTEEVNGAQSPNKNPPSDTTALPNADASPSTSEASSVPKEKPTNDALPVTPTATESTIPFNSSDANASAAIASTPERSPELPESMRRLSRLFDDGSMTLLPDAFSTTSKTETPREKINVESLYHPNPVELPNADWIHDRKLSRLNAAEQPLNRLLVLLGQIAGGPIGWDSNHLRYSGVDPDLKLTLDIVNQDVYSSLDSQLKSKGIGLFTDPSGIVSLRANNSVLEEKLPTDWMIDDLVAETGASDAWRSLLIAYFPSLSTRWSLEKSRVVWTEEASPFEKATVAAFLDQIRNAAGLTIKSKLPTAVTDPLIGLRELDQKLMAKGKLVIAEPMSTSRLLDLAARDVGLELLFDWSALYAHGFSHSADDTILLQGRTWSEIVRFSLDKFSLVAVVDGPQRIQLTTLPNQRQIWRTIIVEAPVDESMEKITDRFRRLSPSDSEGRTVLLSQALPPIANVKPNSKLVVIRICPPNTEQLRDNGLRRLLGMSVAR
jgi:hypothetical protein